MHVFHVFLILISLLVFLCFCIFFPLLLVLSPLCFVCFRVLCRKRYSWRVFWYNFDSKFTWYRAREHISPQDFILSLQFFITVLHSSLFCFLILCMFQTKHWCCWNMRSLTLTGTASVLNPANRICSFFYAVNWRQSFYLTGNLLQHVVLLEHAVPFTDRHSICTESSQ